MAAVPQHVSLVDRSVAANIAFGLCVVPTCFLLSGLCLHTNAGISLTVIPATDVHTSFLHRYVAAIFLLQRQR